ncbi:uncharacterized protein LOC119662005 isoform X2 [Teleopsis dalmanni]|uniref:uncharacterized protein LOC119662005 isoform X2 n=1 Tax=Teleopsis dalmanni TaxID=139649 RepID=UPI0018CE3BDB|nr:uncharacterized protein LOC119662005 isoform X2 [Teleopsis dalmanni]
MTFPFTLLRDGEVDVLLGLFLHSAETNTFFTSSINYLRTPYVFVARNNLKYEQQTDEQTWLLEPYRWSTWICLAVYFLFVKLLIDITRHRKPESIKSVFVNKQKHSGWLELFGVALSIPQNVTNTRNRFCFSIVIWCFGFIVFNTAYQGKLYAAYTDVKPEKSLVLDDIIKNRYNILMRGSIEITTVMAFLKLPTENFISIDSKDPNEIYDLLINRKEKFVVMLTTLHRFLYYVRAKHMYDDYRMVSQYLNMQQICTFFQKNSYLKTPFNRIIRILTDVGLINKWMNDVAAIGLDVYKRNAIHAAAPKPLTLETFKILFVVLFLIELMAFIIFIAEIFIYRWKLKSK